MTKTQQYKQLRASGMTYQQIANKYGVSKQAVHQAVNRRKAAIQHADGSKEWFRNGKPHLEDGPAFEHADGSRGWHRNGKPHLDDGPAVEHRL